MISGKDRGKTGKVLRVDPGKDRVYVERPQHHQAPHAARARLPPAAQVGGVIEREGPIHVSNVMLIDPKDKKRTRVGISREDGRAHARRRAGPEA